MRGAGHGTELGQLSPTPFPGVVFGAWHPRDVGPRPLPLSAPTVRLPLTPPCPRVLHKGPGQPPAGQGGVCQAHVLALDGCPGPACPCPNFRLSPWTVIPASPAHQVSTSFSHCHASGALLAQPSCPDTCPCHQQFPNWAVQEGAHRIRMFFVNRLCWCGKVVFGLRSSVEHR